MDVDRRYFNDTAEYAYINVPQGYQRLCGQQALEYARFRHEDTDLVRGVRQQEVIRATKQQAGVRGLIDKRDELQRIFGKYTTSDASLKNSKAILSLLKLAVFSAGQPIREVHFEGEVGITVGNEATSTPSFVTATDRTVKKLVQQFLGVESSKGVKGKLKPEKGSKGPKRPKRPAGDNGLEKAPGPGQGPGRAGHPAGRRRPAARLLPDGPAEGLAVHRTAALLQDPHAGHEVPQELPDGHQARQARRVLRRAGHHLEGPAAARGQFDKVKSGKRTFELHYDGDRVKLVAWRTPKAVYWISNTLLQSLNKEQMLSIARTTRLP